MRIHHLREHADTPKIPRPVFAHLAHSEVYRSVIVRHAKVEEDFLRTAVAEGVGVEAGAAAGGVHDTSGVIVMRHVWDFAEVETVLEGGRGGVVLHEDTAGVGFDRREGAVAEPEKVPVIAVRGVRDVA